jgi:hypothetical protein
MAGMIGSSALILMEGTICFPVSGKLCADLNDVIGTAVIADVPVLRNLGSTAVTKDNSSAVENHPFWLSGIDGGASLVPIPGKH